jgi:hypothetical protein
LAFSLLSLWLAHVVGPAHLPAQIIRQLYFQVAKCVIEQCYNLQVPHEEVIWNFKCKNLQLNEVAKTVDPIQFSKRCHQEGAATLDSVERKYDKN